MAVTGGGRKSGRVMAAAQKETLRNYALEQVKLRRLGKTGRPGSAESAFLSEAQRKKYAKAKIKWVEKIRKRGGRL